MELTYDEALGLIHSTLKFGSRPGLLCITELLRRLSNPQNHLSFIHVAGTNGKGSTVTYLANIYQSAGCKTGKYLSPYLEDFCERMSVNGEDIKKDEVARYTGRIFSLIPDMERDGFPHPTEFELITAMAFCYFKDAGCDIVALETGLGGRLDATNVIPPPLVSVITSISFDHTYILGDTLDAIAYEKCGIIKSPSPVVLYPVQQDEVIKRVASAANQHGCPLLVPDVRALEVLSSGLSGSSFLFRGEPYEIHMPGRHQVYNALTAIEAVNAARDRIPAAPEHVKAGLKAAKIAARTELLGSRPLFLIDGAHNEGGMQSLVEVIDRDFKNRDVTAVFGMLRDKDYPSCIPKIAKRASRFVATCPDNPRRLPAAETAQIAKEFCAEVHRRDEPEDALSLALSLTPKDGAIVVCGSLYLAGALRPVIIRLIDKQSG